MIKPFFSCFGHEEGDILEHVINIYTPDETRAVDILHVHSTEGSHIQKSIL